VTTRARIAFAAMVLVLYSLASAAQAISTGNDIPSAFNPPTPGRDYTKRVEMVPMRDGVRLYTVIVIPKGASHAPILLTRTPYNAAERATRVESPRMIEELPLSDEVFVKAGYIRVYQDVRGKYGSEGPYLMTPPPVGSFNSSGADDTTDGYDTIDWLTNNLPESNGKVGMIGSSYEGFTIVMALLHPHPALKAAAPESPMVDGWMGDDWFHYGAFREHMFYYFVGQTSVHGHGQWIPREHRDEYMNFLNKGSAGDFARSQGLEQLSFWRKVEAHPAYDAFWQSQALDKLLAAQPIRVPTLWLQGLWDQEDMWGGIHCYQAMEPKDQGNDMNYLVIGPWRHSQINADGRSLGPLLWDGDTAAHVRRDILLPFFNQYLKDDAPKAGTPPVYIYNTGEDHWDRFSSWPPSCDQGCPHKTKPLYLESAGKLSFDGPSESGARFEEYISDPMKPVPYRPQPINVDDWDGFDNWLVLDQRFADHRPDVLTYVTEPLTEPLRVSGVPAVHLYASTSGTDSDWVVKLIDVYPDSYAPPLTMDGYELPISLDIFRGRYRTSFEHPQALQPNEPILFRFDLPVVNHVFQPGHRIMVQVQSTLYPLYDRNLRRSTHGLSKSHAADLAHAGHSKFPQPACGSIRAVPHLAVRTASNTSITSRVLQSRYLKEQR
jgi:putative CocE/NonD family hydrolase